VQRASDFGCGKFPTSAQQLCQRAALTKLQHKVEDVIVCRVIHPAVSDNVWVQQLVQHVCLEPQQLHERLDIQHALHAHTRTESEN